MYDTLSLTFAIWFECSDVVKLLLEKVNSDKLTKLHIAVSNSNYNIVWELSWNFNSLNILNHHKWTLIYLTAKNENLKMMQLLMKLDCFLLFLNNNNWMILHYAVLDNWVISETCCIVNKFHVLIKWLLSQNCNKSATDINKHTFYDFMQMTELDVRILISQSSLNQQNAHQKISRY